VQITKLHIIATVLLVASASYSFICAPKLTEAKLGEMLFFDPILSEDKSISCASCHKPQFAFADTVAKSVGVHGFLTARNTPSVMNMASRGAMFWDGRSTSLEDQVLFPVRDKHEMNLPIDQAVDRLRASKKYRGLFKKVFGQIPNTANIEKAIAAYERTLETSNTANDRWLNDKPDGLTEQQQRGRSVFFNKGLCIECHFTPDFTGDEFRNIGLFDGQKWNDSGRWHVTKKPEDIGKFKVPGLRNVAITAPYMHDGSFKSLREVIEFYNTPSKFINTRSPNIDSLLQQPLGLNEQEMQDLESFLRGLTDRQFEGMLNR
jgi:cytochrome c peroxidase